MSEKKFEELKKEWEKFEVNIDKNEKKKIDECFKRFIKKIKLEDNEETTLQDYAGGKDNERMTLQDYAGGKDNKNECAYFTTFLETKSRKIYGSARPGTMFNAGIYYSKDYDSYYIDDSTAKPKQTIKKQNQDRKYYDTKIAEDVFNNKILPYLQKIVVSDSFDTYKQIEDDECQIGDKKIKRPIKAKLFLRKIVAMNNKGNFLYIYSDEMIDKLYNFFIKEDQDENLTNIEKNQKIVEKVKKILKKKNNQSDEEYILQLSHFLWTKFKFTLDLNAKNIILHGAPGTGKTYFVEENVKVKKMLEGAKYELVQFHPSYSYEDFIDGIKPVGISSGQMQFELKNGIFKQMCIDAFKELIKAKEENREPKKFYFIADEINRAELSRVFGELLLCLEEDKRLKIKKDENKLTVDGTKIKTANSMLWKQEHAVVIVKKNTNEVVTELNDNEEYEFYFGVPENIYFIGTMNDVDRSVDSFDLALRRRFLWKRMDCDYEVILDNLNDYSNIGEIVANNKYTGYLKACYDLNQYITTNKKFKIKNKKDGVSGLDLGITYEIGHAYFLKIDNFIGKQTNKIKDEHLKQLFEFSIEPLLREYLRTNYDEKQIEEKLKVAKKIFSLNTEGKDDNQNS